MFVDVEDYIYSRSDVFKIRENILIQTFQLLHLLLLGLFREVAISPIFHGNLIYFCVKC